MNGKVVLITGAARRIGAAVANHLHEAGATVAIHYNRSAQEANALAEKLNTRRPQSASLHQANIVDMGALGPLVEAVLSAHGRLDGLVNNASTFYPTAVDEVTQEDWDNLFGTNLRAPFFLTQAAAGPLRANGGAIVNIVDINAWRPLERYPVYCAAKAGLDMMTRALARELGPDIRVNGVAPGPILWPEHGYGDDRRREELSATALKRMGDPADIARTVLFLLRDADYITGQIIAVDGGRSV